MKSRISGHFPPAIQSSWERRRRIRGIEGLQKTRNPAGISGSIPLPGGIEGLTERPGAVPEHAAGRRRPGRTYHASRLTSSSKARSQRSLSGTGRTGSVPAMQGRSSRSGRTRSERSSCSSAFSTESGPPPSGAGRLRPEIFAMSASFLVFVICPWIFSVPAERESPSADGSLFRPHSILLRTRGRHLTPAAALPTSAQFFQFFARSSRTDVIDVMHVDVAMIPFLSMTKRARRGSVGTRMP